MTEGETELITVQDGTGTPGLRGLGSVEGLVWYTVGRGGGRVRQRKCGHFVLGLCGVGPSEGTGRAEKSHESISIKRLKDPVRRVRQCVRGP